MTSELILKIYQDENYEFFQLYDMLGDLQKKIWQAVVWWCKRFPNAHPRQVKIAEHVGCSRKHVNSTFKKFRLWGWLILISRGMKKAKQLFVSDSILQIDLVKREYFKRVEVTSKGAYSYSREKNLTSRAGEMAAVPKKKIEIPQIAVELNFSPENSVKLGLVSPFTLEETLRKCKVLGKDGWRPDNAERYLVGMAINIAQQRGEKIDWRAYYRQIDALKASHRP